MTQPNKGVLILHTGSPDAPTTQSVRQYLKRFLMDPYVLTLPGWLRRVLVHGIIAPTRASASAAKYKSIWMPEGSPLVVLTDRFAAALQKMLPNYRVAVGTAYGAQTVTAALEELLRTPLDRIVVLPMFPHFAAATRGSLQALLDSTLGQLPENSAEISIVPPFHSYGVFVDASCGLAAQNLTAFRQDHVVFSYHGLPLKQARAVPTDDSENSYEEQCEQTTAALIAALGLDKSRCTQAYQSRFGRGWLGPELESELVRLAASGRRRVAVLAPSFVTDCLETLEELDLRAKERFIAAGGEAFLRVPALNDHPLWVTAAASIIESYQR